MSQPILDEAMEEPSVASTSTTDNYKASHKRIFRGYLLFLLICLLFADWGGGIYITGMVRNFNKWFTWSYLGYYTVVIARYWFLRTQKQPMTTAYTSHSLLLSLGTGLLMAFVGHLLLYFLYWIIKALGIFLLEMLLSPLSLPSYTEGILALVLCYGIAAVVVALSHSIFYKRNKNKPQQPEPAPWKPFSKWAKGFFVVAFWILLCVNLQQYFSLYQNSKMLEDLLMTNIALIVGLLTWCVVVLHYYKKELIYTILAVIIAFPIAYFTGLVIAMIVYGFLTGGEGWGDFFYGDWSLVTFSFLNIPLAVLLAYGAAYTLDYHKTTLSLSEKKK